MIPVRQELKWTVIWREMDVIFAIWKSCKVDIEGQI